MYLAYKPYFKHITQYFLYDIRKSVTNHAELWGQTLHSGDLDRKKYFFG